MGKKEVYIGGSSLKIQKKKVEGKFVEIENEKFYKISNYNEMPDFFMTIVSDSNHWMFISSNGALSAGRKNRDNALFPYYTVDKIHDYRDKTGSKTYCLVEKNDKTFLWEPFSKESEKIYAIKRNIYKSIYGNKIIFEETNSDLEVCFQYSWCNSEKFGWIKKSNISNLCDSNVTIEILDGIRNILPYGIDYAFQNEYSNLLDAYKKNELLNDSGLGLFMLSAIPVDRAEPSEALKATTVWSYGLGDNSKILISDKQVNNFIQGFEVETETNIRASRGAYYIKADFVIGTNEKKDWVFAAEINQDASQVANLDFLIKMDKNLVERINDDIQLGTSNLVNIVAKADGLQLGSEDLSCARHFSNTMFNVMRGGVFPNDYNLEVSDFILFLNQTNKGIYKQYKIDLDQLPNNVTYAKLSRWATETGNPDLQRICRQYLPLTFSRRHGDPSRPWNQFSIETKNSDGTDKLSYQGNWRDIFQNWEALSLSFPDYTEGMLSIFLNASTADGYNPYRITREGLDWERPDPEDPWAYIGYWGDHQIIYLQKFLEQSTSFHPGKLDELMTKETFVYANVPYRIKSFEEILKDPKDTIVFDNSLQKEIEKITEKIGADGQLIQDKNGVIYKANLTEKILVTLLAKLSNFIPDAGIWLNTQRPEWNDANNALVGNGVSMVTLYYLRRFLKFWEETLSATNVKEVSISEEVENQFFKTYSLFTENIYLLENGFSNEKRYQFTKILGVAGSEYRTSIYENSFSGIKNALSIKTLQEFIKLSLKYINQSIKINKREDGLFHAYNLVSFQNNSISIRHLYEMLEGQVAVLSSGYLTVQESLNVLDALKSSKLFSQDQYSYILYPDRELPSFSMKNNIPGDLIKHSGLLNKIVANDSSSIITKDNNGVFHFNGDFRNAGILKDALESLQSKSVIDINDEEITTIISWYEQVFDHQSFTGRSGTFFGYEGLGSIYWHMVSKLLLASQECYFKGVEENEDINVTSKIKDHYYEIKAGIGLYKSPELYGAFPTDAYSHTPGNAGAKQPGLTGQVKEDVISRLGELGIHTKNGEIIFNTSLLNRNEILKREETFSYVDLKGSKSSLDLSENQLAFTYCQVPVIYTFGEVEGIRILYSDGQIKEISGNTIDASISSQLFSRTGEIARIDYMSKD